MSASEALDRLLQERQADRLPSVAAAVARKGELAWSNAVGSANYDEEREATPGTQYRIGSITKTFTATAIMQLRDLGALDLDDRLGQHVEGLADGSPTIRRLLAQYDSSSHRVLTDFLAAYEFVPGTVFYAGYGSLYERGPSGAFANDGNSPASAAGCVVRFSRFAR